MQIKASATALIAVLAVTAGCASKPDKPPKLEAPQAFDAMERPSMRGEYVGRASDVAQIRPAQNFMLHDTSEARVHIPLWVLGRTCRPEGCNAQVEDGELRAPQPRSAKDSDNREEDSQ